MLYVKQLIDEITIDNSVLYKTMYCSYNDHRKYIFCCVKRNKTVIICVITIKKMLMYVLKKISMNTASSVNTGVPFYRESDFCLIIYCYYFAP